MKYLELKPSDHLAKYIKCFWIMENSKSKEQNVPNPIIPDGQMEIIFNLSDRFRRYHFDGKIETQPKSIIAGQLRSFTMIEPLGKVNLFGIRFRTSGTYPYCRFSLSELTDKIESLDSVWGKTGRILEEQIDEAQTFEQRIIIAEQFLSRILIVDNDFDYIFKVASNLMIEHNGMISIEDISKNIGISSRKLERNFQQKIGITPKFLSRLIRFKNFLKAVRKQKGENLFSIALELGYYDQAHLIHEFKVFSGNTPSVFLETEYQISERFIDYGH